MVVEYLKECVVYVYAGLSKFAKLARSVTRSRSVLVSALPALKEPQRQSHLAHVSTTALHVNTHALLLFLYVVSVTRASCRAFQRTLVRCER